MVIGLHVIPGFEKPGGNGIVGLRVLLRLGKCQQGEKIGNTLVEAEKSQVKFALLQAREAVQNIVQFGVLDFIEGDDTAPVMECESEIKRKKPSEGDRQILLVSGIICESEF